MAASGVSGYAAVNARVRVMYASLLSQQDLLDLYETPDFNALMAALKNTAYGPYLERVKDKDLTPRRAAFQLRGRLADDYASIIGMAPTQTRPLLVQFFRNFEADNIKAVLRGLVADSSWDLVRFVLFPMGSLGKAPTQAMMETGNVPAAVELLRGTPYYAPLSFALKRFTAEQNLFPMEVALDLDYWRELWRQLRMLPVEDRTHAMRILGPLVDMNNLMWVVRYREYHHLSEEELINYTLPFGYRVQDHDIRAIAAGADLAMTITRLFPELHRLDSVMHEPRQALPALEFALQSMVVQHCHAAFIGDPFHIGVPLAYLILQEMMIHDLTVLIEAKSTHAPLESYRPYILMDAAAAQSAEGVLTSRA